MTTQALERAREVIVWLSTKSMLPDNPESRARFVLQVRQLETLRDGLGRIRALADARADVTPIDELTELVEAALLEAQRLGCEAGALP